MKQLGELEIFIVAIFLLFGFIVGCDAWNTALERSAQKEITLKAIDAGLVQEMTANGPIWVAREETK